MIICLVYFFEYVNEPNRNLCLMGVDIYSNNMVFGYVCYLPSGVLKRGFLGNFQN